MKMSGFQQKAIRCQGSLVLLLSILCSISANSVLYLNHPRYVYYIYPSPSMAPSAATTSATLQQPSPKVQNIQALLEQPVGRKMPHDEDIEPITQESNLVSTITPGTITKVTNLTSVAVLQRPMANKVSHIADKARQEWNKLSVPHRPPQKTTGQTPNFQQVVQDVSGFSSINEYNPYSVQNYIGQSSNPADISTSSYYAYGGQGLDSYLSHQLSYGGLGLGSSSDWEIAQPHQDSNPYTLPFPYGYHEQQQHHQTPQGLLPSVPGFQENQFAPPPSPHPQGDLENGYNPHFNRADPPEGPYESEFVNGPVVEVKDRVELMAYKNKLTTSRTASDTAAFLPFSKSTGDENANVKKVVAKPKCVYSTATANTEGKNCIEIK